jgi:hypothetical protein
MYTKIRPLTRVSVALFKGQPYEVLVAAGYTYASIIQPFRQIPGWG